MRRSSAQLVFRVLITVIALCLVLPVQAFAALEDDPKATSATNPAWPNGEEIWWRDGWGNTLYPNLRFGAIPSDASSDGVKIETLGFYYWVTRGSVPVTETVTPRNVSIDPEGGMHEQTYDLAGMFADESLGVQVPNTIEGTWTVWVAFYNRFRVSNWLVGYDLCYDGTKPTGVSNLIVSPTSNGAGADTWTETTRRYIRWTPAYDAVSGIGVYRYELNDKFVAYHPARIGGEPVYAPLITVETLPPGKNKITITPVDKATNKGPSSTVYAYVDPDVPQIKLTSPSANVVGVKPTIKASASDAAGIRSVKFYVNDKLVYTDTAAPYQATPSLSGYAQGSWVKLSAVVEDMFGHTATASKSCKLDKVAPGLSSISDSADPFYPVKQDGYKDSSTVKFALGEKATVFLRIYNSKGKLYREVKVSRDKGSRSVKWDGKNSSGVVNTGTFSYKLTAVDAAGNARTSKSYATHIKNYEIVRISKSAVKVIPR